MTRAMAALIAFAVTAVACVRPNEHSKDMDGDVARTDHGSCSLATLPGRSAGATCDDTRPTGPLDLLRPTPFLGGCPVFVCSEHDDCTSGENGRCVGNSKDGQYCTYDTCFTDEDCSDQQLDFLATPGEYAVCVCEGGLFSDNNRCVPANCRPTPIVPTGGSAAHLAHTAAPTPLLDTTATLVMTSATQTLTVAGVGARTSATASSTRETHDAGPVGPPGPARVSELRGLRKAPSAPFLPAATNPIAIEGACLPAARRLRKAPSAPFLPAATNPIAIEGACLPAARRLRKTPSAPFLPAATDFRGLREAPGGASLARDYKLFGVFRFHDLLGHASEILGASASLRLVLSQRLVFGFSFELAVALEAVRIELA